MIIFEKKEVILQCDNVSLSYDKPILKNIDFKIHNITRTDVNQGQVISLIGKSGIGKTQLFRILAGLQKPTTGKVLISQNLHEVKLGEVGVVPQNYIFI